MSPARELPEIVAALPEAARARFERLFAVERVVGTTDPPPEMHAWLERQFGSVEAVRRQEIVRVTNRWSLDGALFSPLRSRRPIEGGQRQPAGAVPDAGAEADCPFCDPERRTPAETWGRVRSARAVTGANAAKYDAHHGVIVFDEHDPLAFDEERITDLLDIGRAWADRVRATDPEATNYLLIWNCGQRAGGSIVHGHAQVLLGSGRPYARVERLRRDAAAYAAATGTPYLADLAAALADVGLGIEGGDGAAAVVASLTPVKEREVLVIGPAGADERDPGFAAAVARTVVAFRDVLGVRAFNLAVLRPPLGTTLEGGVWDGIGPVVRLVDRGDPSSPASDIGAMELWAASVVGTDPFDVADRLRARVPAAG